MTEQKSAAEGSHRFAPSPAESAPSAEPAPPAEPACHAAGDALASSAAGPHGTSGSQQPDAHGQAAHPEATVQTPDTADASGDCAADDVMPDEEILYDLADLFKIFSDTTRIKILYSLIDGEHRVADIATMVGATQSAVSHQLRVLKQARLVRFQRDGKSVVYSLADDHVLTILAQGMSHICE